MKAILKQIKKFIPLIIGMLFFITVQAFADLRLPRFTSDIVNIGIQQGGITDSLPAQMRDSEYEKFLLLLAEEENGLLQSSYIEQEGKYVLKEDIGEDEKAMLREAMMAP